MYIKETVQNWIHEVTKLEFYEVLNKDDTVSCVVWGSDRKKSISKNVLKLINKFLNSSEIKSQYFICAHSGVTKLLRTR